MSRTRHARKGSTSRRNPCKGPRDSLKFDKQDWNGKVRRDGKRFVRELSLALFANRLVPDGWTLRFERVRPPLDEESKPWLD